MGLLAGKVKALRVAVLGLRPLINPRAALSTGFHLCEDVISEPGVCGGLNREVPRLGDCLMRADKSFVDAMRQTHQGAASALEELRDLKQRVVDKHAQTVIAHLDKFMAYLREVDGRFRWLDKCLEAVVRRAREMQTACLHCQARRAFAGRLLQVGGWVALLLGAAAFAARRHTSPGGQSGPLLNGLPPVKTSLSGGIAAVLGGAVVSTAELHRRLAAAFGKLADEAASQVAVLQRLRTRLHRLMRALGELEVHFKVNSVVGGLSGDVWPEIGQWVEAYEEALGQLVKGSEGFGAGN
ncbi:unnamed protein product [Ostreobium quekettii]|uniref:Uncharacterized protein n=1 Tax=Ostreobium quekettii TaxID=121088 RepID=A0A8S1J3Z0_9CHLO|nr:unnamed protein product [Ostreobium quekettii]|eukprot:evm.model.scf_851.4 EVM.evm.TU.scf_851.4   scf_851:37872-38762(+)